MATAARTGHLERTAEEPRDRRLHEVRLSRVDQVNERIRQFRLELQSGPAKFLPGQWLDTYVPGIEKAGGFTITSTPSAAAGEVVGAATPPYLELAVQESPGNEVAAWLWRAPDEIVGALLLVRIGGSFVFPPLAAPSDSGSAAQQQQDLNNVRSVFFVAGGVGINPLVSMLSALAETSPLHGGGGGDALHVSVLYATKMPASGNLSDVLFMERLAKLFGEGRLKGLLRIYATDGTGARLPPEGTCELHGAQVKIRHGRISEEQVRTLVGERGPEASLVYICGPPMMTDQLAAALTSGVGGKPFMEPGRVLTEKWW
ncbi:hypothetical protein PCL_12319 [Purpureocillium lilacinum]|uniref:Oxidoreductase NAD-binding domain-containing protein 1 n=1 Tax=Purpureocillium lilacinum TaxID=33203 RepID=A0A2U3E8W8_PURLI|nr:hypothetical protein PCL_12319 [Purpureocillium lilacinum]